MEQPITQKRTSGAEARVSIGFGGTAEAVPLRIVFCGSRRGGTNPGRAVAVVLLLWLAGAGSAAGQGQAPAAFDFTAMPSSFPRFYDVYKMREVPGPNLENSAAVAQAARGGTLRLSLEQMLGAVVENNLGLAAARYNLSMAETDILRARSGQAPRGTNGAPIPAGLFAGAIGAGLNTGGFQGGPRTGGGEGNISGNARIVQISPRGTYDPRLSINFSVDTETSPLNSTRVSGVATPTSHTTAVQMFYSQAFTTGTSFSLNWNMQRGSTTQLNQLFNPSFSGRMNFAVNQRLWNGFGYAVTRRFEHVAENNTRLSREAFRQQAIATLANAQNLYWDLVASREQVRAAEQALAVAERLRDDNAKQVQIGTLAPLDVVAAEAEVAARRRDLIAAQTNEQLREVQLKNVMVKSLDSDLGAARIETTDSLPDPQHSDIPGQEEALATAMRNRPEIARAEGGIMNQKIVTEFTKNNLKPSLNVFAQYINVSRAGFLSGSFGQIGRFEFPEFAFGVTLTIPILNRSAQADDVRAKLELRQSETMLQRTRNQIRLEVRNALIGLMQAQAQVAAARKALDLSRRTLDAEERKLQAGISTPYNVIQVQRDFEQAQFAEVAARANYAKARVALDQVTGEMLEKHGIPLDRVIRGQS